MKYLDLFHGKTVFTISNQEKHYTFKVEQIGDYNRFIVKVLTGSDNSNSYTYLGMLFSRSPTPVKLTVKSKFNKDSTPYKAFVYAQGVLSGNIKISEGFSILPSGTCFKCGRKLTTPESIRTGLGPVCGGRV